MRYVYGLAGFFVGALIVLSIVVSSMHIHLTGPERASMIWSGLGMFAIFVLSGVLASIRQKRRDVRPTR